MKNVADIYPLSPMQEVMLLHAQTCRDEDVLLNQAVFTLTGALDVTAFAAAWQELTHRHAALRTAFQWQGLKRPMQVVRQAVDVVLREEDLRAVPAAQRADTLEHLLQQDRDDGFEFTRAPLNRLLLVRLDEQNWTFAWTSHHLIFDRWCIGTIFAEVADAYAAARRGTAAAPVPARQYRDYISWLAAQDRAGTETFWQGALAGFTAPSLLTKAVTPAQTYPRVQVAAGSTALATLRNGARRLGTTPGALVQLAWALVTHRHCGSNDVVFGLTVAGRPAALPGVESMLGTFVNNVPVRFELTGELTVGAVLDAAQAHQASRVRHDYLALPDLHQLSALDDSAPLFDCLMVWLAAEGGLKLEGLEVRHLPAQLRSGFPLTLTIGEQGDDLLVALETRPDVTPLVPPEVLLHELLEITATLAAATDDARLEQFGASTAAPVCRERGRAPEPLIGRTSPIAVSDAASIRGREEADPSLLTDLVTREWQSVLQLNEVRPEDDFFALGGNSLRAAQLHSRVVAATRKAIPLLALFAEPTIAAMVRALVGEQWPVQASVCVPVRGHGSARPLFCVASPEVNTVGYAMLSRHLHQARPVFVLQAPPDTDALRRLSPRELPGLAERYVGAMTDVQAVGPYQLLGMCTGAQLAVEMARVLEARGDRATFVGVVNTWGYYTVSRLIVLHRVRSRVMWYRRRARRAFAGGAVAGTLEIVRLVLKRIPGLGHLAPPSAPTVDDEAAPAAAALPAEGETDEWLEEYGPASKQPQEPPIGSPVVVFRLRRQPFWRIRDRALGWGKQARRVAVTQLHGKRHLDILREPDVAELGSAVERCLTNNDQERLSA